jgi:hypothetical protein
MYDVSLIDSLYGVCSAMLLVSSLLVLGKNPGSPVHRRFSGTALTLLAWLITLLLFQRASVPDHILYLGRFNFATIPLAVYLGYLFVAGLAQKHIPQPTLQVAGSLLLFLLSAFTPLVDKAELPGTGLEEHQTLYGPLFPFYLLYIVGYLFAAVSLAFRERVQAPQPQRDQLTLVGAGILATGSVALLTNALLPYAFDNFRFVDVGTLSTILFLFAVAWAVIRHRLFNVKVFVRKTLVWGLLLSFVLAAYGAVVTLVTEHLVGGDDASAVTRFGVLIIASSFDPIRRFLEKKVDHFLFPISKQRSA